MEWGASSFRDVNRGLRTLPLTQVFLTHGTDSEWPSPGLGSPSVRLRSKGELPPDGTQTSKPTRRVVKRGEWARGCRPDTSVTIGGHQRRQPSFPRLFGFLNPYKLFSLILDLKLGHCVCWESTGEVVHNPLPGKRPGVCLREVALSVQQISLIPYIKEGLPYHPSLYDKRFVLNVRSEVLLSLIFCPCAEDLHKHPQEKDLRESLRDRVPSTNPSPPVPT